MSAVVVHRVNNSSSESSYSDSENETTVVVKRLENREFFEDEVTFGSLEEAKAVIKLEKIWTALNKKTNKRQKLT